MSIPPVTQYSLVGEPSESAPVGALCVHPVVPRQCVLLSNRRRVSPTERSVAQRYQMRGRRKRLASFIEKKKINFFVQLWQLFATTAPSGVSPILQNAHISVFRAFPIFISFVESSREQPLETLVGTFFNPHRFQTMQENTAALLTVKSKLHL